MNTKMLIPFIALFLVNPSQAEIISQQISYRDNGTTMNGLISYDNSIKGKRPGVLVVHEWWGHNAYARKRAEMLAQLGYTALAVDMYGDGKTANHPKDAGKFSQAVGGNMPLAKARFEAALKTLKNHQSVNTENIAAIGYCFGGGIVLNMARSGIDLKGVASFHGSLASGITAEKGNVKTQIRVYNGADDPFVKAEQIENFKKEMDAAKVSYLFVNYPGAKHSFTNPEANKFGAKFGLPLAYNATADKQSWHSMQLFFKNIFK